MSCQNMSVKRVVFVTLSLKRNSLNSINLRALLKHESIVIRNSNINFKFNRICLNWLKNQWANRNHLEHGNDVVNNRCKFRTARYSSAISVLSFLLSWTESRLYNSFQPLTEHFLAASFALGKVDQKMLTKLRPCLQKLDKALAEQFLSKRDQPGSIDVICWSLLLPCMDKASPACEFWTSHSFFVITVETAEVEYVGSNKNVLPFMFHLSGFVRLNDNKR